LKTYWSSDAKNRDFYLLSSDTGQRTEGYVKTGGPTPPPGKYSCAVLGTVGVQTNEKTQERFRGVIQASPERQKFFITIEEVKPAWSDKKHQTDYCFGKEAINNLKAIRRGQQQLGLQLSDEFMYFQTCLARYVVKFSGELGKVETDKYSDNTNLFRDTFTRFWIYGVDQKDFHFLWNYDIPHGWAVDHFMADGMCEKIN
jgi:hypothetical protein